ncbi:MAG: hypothetical protein JRD93_06085 [Deltaproteobacteria bacterium]|nr:hypothetical protein [Deltaproteobacteria bacterium]
MIIKAGRFEKTQTGKTICNDMQRILSHRIKANEYSLAYLLLIILIVGIQNVKAVEFDSPFCKSPGVAFHPRAFVPQSDDCSPKREQVVEDLRLLRKSGFRSLVTYSASNILGSVPEIARQLGFDGSIIMGVWDPLSEHEWDKAITQAPFVNGYCLGNEGLGVRYSQIELASKMKELRRLTGRPVTTSEPIDSYLKGIHRDWLLINSDWLFPNAHPFLANQSDPDCAVDWVVARYDYLAATTGRRVVIKETGFPSSGSEICNEEDQLSFFEALVKKGIAFFYFEAFDQPWKRDVLKQPAVEAHWGLYRADGTPKKVILWFADHWLE